MQVTEEAVQLDRSKPVAGVMVKVPVEAVIAAPGVTVKTAVVLMRLV